MQGFGLPPAPAGVSAAVAAPPSLPAPAAVSGSIGGIMPFMNLAAMREEEKKARDQALAQQQNLPIIAGLAGHIKKQFTAAEQARQTVEQEMLDAMYARRGEYTAKKRAEIVASKQPLIYMMLAASKMRQVESLLRDVLTGTGTEKPWTLRPTPVPDLPTEEVQKVAQALQGEIQQLLMAGIIPSVDEVRQRVRLMRDQLETRLAEEARVRCERMENKMEDQLVEGGFPRAMDEFITDLATFKTAFLKGPVVRNKPRLSWGPNAQPVVETTLTLEWERVSPFDMYPAPWARNINEGPLIQRHRLTREELNQMIGVEGYSKEAIEKVIEDYGAGGLRGWLSIDTQVAAAEGKDSSTTTTGTELIDALQYWGSASGQMLLDWGLPSNSVQDATKEYQIEAWLIGPYVIKAVLNADPLARRPYYASSFSKIPGSVWGNCPYDLMVDCQDMCNGAARALAANLGISSGPQVAILSSRLPPGEDVTDMYPWKIWQFDADPMGSTADPIKFFQPTSNAAELMGVYEKFSILADEYTGIPKYMSGFNAGAGGAGRTASGMSMMIGNASKIIKQTVGSIDGDVTTPSLERLYYYNMRYGDDPELKGDVRVVAKGALSVQVKEAAQVRRNEFLAATANPIDMQIIGLDGRAEVLRETAKGLDMNTDKVVPPVAVLKERAAMQAMQQAAVAQQQQGQQAQAQQQEQDQNARKEQRESEMHNAKLQNVKSGTAKNNNQLLMNGAPATDHFQPA